MALIVTACGNSPSPSLSSTDALLIGVPEGSGEDRAEAGIAYLASTVSLEGLTQISIEGRALPNLAESWSWSGDEHRLSLRLRPDVLLHDGRAFDSQIAAEALARAVAQPINRAQYPSLSVITAAIPSGPLELVLWLSGPAAMLPEDLTILLNVPAGPYREVNRASDAIELERFEAYFRGAPQIQRITLRPLDTLRTAWASLLRGELDMVYDVPADAIEFIRNDDVQVISVPRWYQFAIAFNSARPALRSPLVRRALNMAIDRGGLIERVLSGRGMPATGPIWPRYWAYDSSVAAVSFDPPAAAALLDQAGLPLPDAVRTSVPAAPARFTFTCLIPENFAVWEHLALEVQRDLFNIGVSVQFEVLPVELFNQRIAKGDFDAVFFDLVSGPTPTRPFIFWRSAAAFRGAYNVFGYENADAERLFNVLRTSTNEAAVRSATQRLQRIMADDPPALFLAWSERARAIRRDIEIPASDGRDFMWTIWNWSRSPSRLASAR